MRSIRACLLTMCSASALFMACADHEDANEPCNYVEDGECDEPAGTGLCRKGTDRADCSGEIVRCPFRNDGFCDEPEGTGDCDEGSDREDCATAQTCQFVDDGTCDEPEGTARCDDGTDTIDCLAQMQPCSLADNGICDEPEGTGACIEGTDASDCNGAPVVCVFTNNGVCNEPEGSNTCAEGTDVADCSIVSSCPSTNDGICNEPEGTNTCPEGTDSTDCPTLVCGVTACEPITFGGLDIPAGLSLGCCTADARCGISMSDGCIALQEPQPGACPSYDLSGAMPVAGCCLPSGMCGLIFPSASTDYCVEVSTEGSPLGPFMPITPTDCGGLDSDAGVE